MPKWQRSIKMASEPYEVLVGVGTLYIAAAGTAAPAVNATPSASWTNVGETDGGVKVIKTQNIEKFTTDQRTGNNKAVRTEEGVSIETNLSKITLENLASVIGGTLTDTAPGSGTIGIRTLPLRRGATVDEFAVLYRGDSPYGAYPGQYYVPRGYFTDDIEMEFVKDGKTLIPVKFEALEYDSASSESERFGKVTYQDAAATA
jgi:hypothetical protein